MDEFSILLEALKWVIIVFIAGFVGYFGKYLGMQIIDKVKKTDNQEPAPASSAEELALKHEKELRKQQKKELKAAAKQNKKTSSDS